MKRDKQYLVRLRALLLAASIAAPTALLSGCSEEKIADLETQVAELNNIIAQKDAIITEYQAKDSEYEQIKLSFQESEDQKAELEAKITELEEQLSNLLPTEETNKEEERIESEKYYVLDTTKLDNSELDMGNDYREYPIFIKYDYYPYPGEIAVIQTQEIIEAHLKKYGNCFYRSLYDYYDVTYHNGLLSTSEGYTMYMYINEEGIYANRRTTAEEQKDLGLADATVGSVKVPIEAFCTLNEFLQNHNLSEMIKDSYTSADLQEINIAINNKETSLGTNEDGVTMSSMVKHN